RTPTRAPPSHAPLSGLLAGFGVAMLTFEHAGHRHHGIAFRHPRHADAGGVPTLLGDLVDAHANQVAGRREHDDLITRSDDERGHDHTARLRDTHPSHALAAAALTVE